MVKNKKNIAIIGASVPRFSLEMCRGVQQGLLDNGVDARFFDITDRPTYSHLLDYYAEMKTAGTPFSIFDINGSVLEALPAAIKVKKKFTYIIDHPVFHLDRIQGYGGGMILGFVDMIHMADRGDLGITQDSLFLPHGGPAPDPDPVPLSERNMDVLFCGNISPLIAGSVFRERLDGLPEKLAEIARESIEVILAEHSPPFRTLKTVAEGHSVDLLETFSRAELEDACSMIEDFVTAAMRIDLLKKVSARSVHVCGKLPDGVSKDEVFGAGTGIELHGYVPYDRLQEIMQRAKILLNYNPVQLGGSHERIWEGMARGCAVATNESLYMREQFDDGKNILIAGTGPDDPIADRIGGLLTDTPALEEMIASAARIYARDHTWKARAQTILGAL